MRNRMKNDKAKASNEAVELINADARCISVLVDGDALPLDIGSKLNIGDGLVRTVMKVQVNEDGNVMYGIQWIDGVDFKLEWMTYSELCHMSSCLRNKSKITLYT